MKEPSSMNLVGSGPGSPYSPRLPTLSSDLEILSNDGVRAWCIDMLLSISQSYNTKLWQYIICITGLYQFLYVKVLASMFDRGAWLHRACRTANQQAVAYDMASQRQRLMMSTFVYSLLLHRCCFSQTREIVITLNSYSHCRQYETSTSVCCTRPGPWPTSTSWRHCWSMQHQILCTELPNCYCCLNRSAVKVVLTQAYIACY